MKLLTFTENYAFGGGNRYMVDLVNAISAEYREVVFACNDGGISCEDLARLRAPARLEAVFMLTRARMEGCIATGAWQRPARVLMTLIEPLMMGLNVLILMRLLRREAPKRLLVCNGGYPGGAACLAAAIAGRLLKVDTWMSIASIPAARRSHMRLYERWLDRLVWRCCRHVIVNADAIERQLRVSRDLPVGKAVRVRNGIEDRSASRPAGQNAEVVIGCVARMDELKGALILVEAFINLARTHPEVRLVLAGTGNAMSRMRMRLREVGLEHRVHELGEFRGDVHELLQTFDMFAFPSLWEGFPYSVIEAMRAGCAIVGSRVGGVPEAILDERDGLLVSPGSVPELVAALTRLVEDSGLRLRLGVNARFRFEREFSLEMMHEQAHLALMEPT